MIENRSFREVFERQSRPATYLDPSESPSGANPLLTLVCKLREHREFENHRRKRPDNIPTVRLKFKLEKFLIPPH
jgi:hypothetical protein